MWACPNFWHCYKTMSSAKFMLHNLSNWQKKSSNVFSNLTILCQTTRFHDLIWNRGAFFRHVSGIYCFSCEHFECWQFSSYEDRFSSSSNKLFECKFDGWDGWFSSVTDNWNDRCFIKQFLKVIPKYNWFSGFQSNQIQPSAWLRHQLCQEPW